tara:strand:+ start:777 stop:977 length:201 start_codon:yes stop_codon:yes gene_type:complete
MYIAPEQHVSEPQFVTFCESALTLEVARIVKRAEQHVPNRKVGIILGMPVFAVMDTMAFGPLKNEP